MEVEMVTYKFIYRIKIFFNTIKYKPENQFDIDDLFNKLIVQVLKCTDVYDINNLFLEYSYCKKKRKKINKMLNNRKKVFFEEIKDKLEINFYCKENSSGNYIITSALSRKRKRIDLLSFDDGNIYRVKRKGNKYYLFKDYEYYLVHKFGRAFIYCNKERRIKIIYKKYLFSIKSKLFNLSIQESDYGYDIIDNNIIENDKVIAMFDTDILDSKKNFATSLIETFEGDIEINLLVGLASVFLIQDSIELIKRRKMMMASYLLNR